MNHKLMFRTGLVGTVITAMCCFTPLLVLVFGAIGLSSLTGYLDFVLLPLLLLFLVLTIWAWRKQRAI